MLLLPFSRCFDWPTLIDIFVLVATSFAMTRVFLLALQYRRHSLIHSYFSTYVFLETQSTSLSRLYYDRVSPADRRGSHVFNLGPTFSSASRPRVVDPVSFSFSSSAAYFPPTYCLSPLFSFAPLRLVCFFPFAPCLLFFAFDLFPIPDSQLLLE